MKGVLILFVTAIVMFVGNRTHGVHRHRHAKTGLKPVRDTGSIILKPLHLFCLHSLHSLPMV